MTATAIKTFYATTRIFQGDSEFVCSWDFSGEADLVSAINHLTCLLEEASDAFQEQYEEGEEINLHGMSAREFATFLVTEELIAEVDCETTWEISTNFQEVDADNWEHPGNL